MRYFIDSFTFALSILGSVFCAVGCKTVTNDTSMTKNGSTDIPGLPPRAVVVANLPLGASLKKELSDNWGYIDGNNCFMVTDQSNPAGHKERYLDVFTIPCGPETSAPSLTEEALKKRIVHQEMDAMAKRPFYKKEVKVQFNGESPTSVYTVQGPLLYYYCGATSHPTSSCEFLSNKALTNDCGGRDSYESVTFSISECDFHINGAHQIDSLKRHQDEN